ncbi:MAG: TIGR03619 family F420-dependent LLM class oxidoreductase [Myxococcota bacterium]
MRFGISLRTMGQAATRDVLRASAGLGEAAGLDTLWIPDHIAIPPDDAEGSDGRYLDPLASLAWLAAATERIRLGTAVLILPYRPALPTAKAIATIQELSGGRLELGVGVGWMEAEFRAVGVDRRDRGRIADEGLAFLHAAFDGPGDRAVSNGQAFLFRPNPRKPRIWIGGSAPHALTRAARFGDGWMPMTDDPEKLREPIAELARLFAEAGRGKPEVAVFAGLGRRTADEELERLAQLEELGVDELIQGARYDDLDGFRRALDPLLDRRDAFRSR